MTGDETRLTSLQLISTYSLPTQPMKSCTTPPWSTPPTLYQQKRGFFYVKQESEQWRSYTCETGPKVYRPYPRRFRQKSLYGRRQKSGRCRERVMHYCLAFMTCEFFHLDQVRLRLFYVKQAVF